MENAQTDSLWGIVQAAVAAGVAGLGGVVAWMWQKLSTVDEVSHKVDALAASIDDVLERQSRIESDQHKADILVAKLEETLNWLRTAISEINRKLDK